MLAAKFKDGHVLLAEFFNSIFINKSSGFNGWGKFLMLLKVWQFFDLQCIKFPLKFFFNSKRFHSQNQIPAELSLKQRHQSHWIEILKEHLILHCHHNFRYSFHPGKRILFLFIHPLTILAVSYNNKKKINVFNEMETRFNSEKKLSFPLFEWRIQGTLN